MALLFGMVQFGVGSVLVLIFSSWFNVSYDVAHERERESLVFVIS